MITNGLPLQIVALRLRDLRQARGLSQEAVAEQLGVTDGAISKYENCRVANIGVSLLQELLTVYGVEPRDFFCSDQDFDDLIMSIRGKEAACA